MRARTCARYQGARLSGVSSSESASRRGHARATRSSCRTSSTGLSPALSRRSAGNRVRLEKSRIRFRETYRRSTFRHTARRTSASISESAPLDDGDATLGRVVRAGVVAEDLGEPHGAVEVEPRAHAERRA